MAQFMFTSENKKIKLYLSAEILNDKAKEIVVENFGVLLENGRKLSDLRLASGFFQWFQNREIELLNVAGLITVPAEVWAVACMKADVEGIVLTLCGAVLTPEDIEAEAPPNRKTFAISRAAGWINDKRNDPWGLPKFDGDYSITYWTTESAKLGAMKAIERFIPVPILPIEQLEDQSSISSYELRCCDNALASAMVADEFHSKSESEILQLLIQQFYLAKREFIAGGISFAGDDYCGIALQHQFDIIQMATQIKQLFVSYLGSERQAGSSVAKLIMLQTVARMRKRKKSAAFFHVPTSKEIEQIDNEVFADSGYVSRGTLSSTSTPGTSRAVLASHAQSQSGASESVGESAGATSESQGSQGLRPPQGNELVVFHDIELLDSENVYYLDDKGNYFLTFEEVPRVMLKDPTELDNARQKYTNDDGGVAAGKYLRDILYTHDELKTTNWSGRVEGDRPRKNAFKGDSRTTFVMKQLERFKHLGKGGEEMVEPDPFSKQEEQHIINNVFTWGLPT